MILRNSAMCGDCWQEIVSRHKHDYITCSCGQLSIDGGSSYLKRNSNHYVDTSLSSEDDFDKIRNVIVKQCPGVYVPTTPSKKLIGF